MRGVSHLKESSDARYAVSRLNGSRGPGRKQATPNVTTTTTQELKRTVRLALWLSFDAALHVAGPIPARNKYMYGLQVFLKSSNVCKCTHDTGVIPSVQFLSDNVNTRFMHLLTLLRELVIILWLNRTRLKYFHITKYKTFYHVPVQMKDVIPIEIASQ